MQVSLITFADDGAEGSAKQYERQKAWLMMNTTL